ncbi:uncharacterized protein [Littorina saxatilis]|uniref:uncharacterized protein n=1 Tax=Littorina saxatilis TaxID=31220 RepID=UPI0038B4615F
MPTTTVATTTTPTPTTITTTTPTTTSTSPATTLSSNCKDTNTNCAAFGKSFCSQSTYIDWAKTNCARYCNLCEESSVSTPVAMPTTTTSKPESALPSNCLDVASNCQQYGTDFCSKPAYVAWAKENCARYCNLCEDNHAVETVAVAVATTPKPASTQASTIEFAVKTIAVAKVTSPKPAPTQTATEAVDASCMDAVDNCDQYGSSFCSQADYVDWAKENCIRHCQFCVSKSLPGEEVCVDKLESCAQYDKGVCKNQQYKEWAEANCAKYCGICRQGEVKGTTTTTQTTTIAQTTTTPSPTTTAATKKSNNVITSPSSACQDKVSNCAAFGQSFCTDERYANFAKDNCQRHCKFCGAPTPVAGGKECKDEVDNCVSYDKSVCHSSDYEEWSRTNCAKFCGFCSEEGSIAEKTTQSKENAGGTSESGFCKDVYDSCKSYGESVCTGPYEGWAVQNCQKFCDLCGETRSGGVVGSSSGRGRGNGGDNNGIGTPTNVDSGNGIGNKNGNGNSGDNNGIGTPTNVDSGKLIL